jgi:hypothetical protein
MPGDLTHGTGTIEDTLHRSGSRGLIPAERPLLSVSACPHPFEGRRVDYAVPAGLSIAEIVELIQPDLDAAKWGLLAVTLIGISVMLWARIDDRRKGLR